ncbi:MAG: N-acetylmuramoyl-L-alanine amidase, partial [Clostridiales bacterium]|nr:N-acetylmuramoyl-L-alanine amidase [Clostridiales bacterium]
MDNSVDKWTTCVISRCFCAKNGVFDKIAQFSTKAAEAGFFMMLVLKKRIILIAAGVLAVLTGLSVTVSLATGYANGAGAPRLGFSVVIDAGHGGIDGGVSGVNTGIKESEINLLVAKKLEAYFKKAGVDVVMTRTNSNGLYGLSTNNFKTRDMRERERIIREAAPDIVISVHQNFFPRASQRGAQVFYKLESDASQTLAAAVRRALA